MSALRERISFSNYSSPPEILPMNAQPVIAELVEGNSGLLYYRMGYRLTRMGNSFPIGLLNNPKKLFPHDGVQFPCVFFKTIHDTFGALDEDTMRVDWFVDKKDPKIEPHLIAGVRSAQLGSPIVFRLVELDSGWPILTVGSGLIMTTLLGDPDEGRPSIYNKQIAPISEIVVCSERKPVVIEHEEENGFSRLKGLSLNEVRDLPHSTLCEEHTSMNMFGVDQNNYTDRLATARKRK